MNPTKSHMRDVQLRIVRRDPRHPHLFPVPVVILGGHDSVTKAKIQWLHVGKTRLPLDLDTLIRIGNPSFLEHHTTPIG